MKNAVVAPMMSTNDNADSDCSNNGDILATMKMPAVTMVGGVDQRRNRGRTLHGIGQPHCSGTCADLPMAPMNRQMQVNVIAGQLIALLMWNLGACEGVGMRETPSRSRASPCSGRFAAMPSTNPKSPTRLTTKALRLANTADGRVYQNPISR